MVDGDVTQQSREPKDLQRLTSPKATIDVQKQSKPLANPPIDPDAEERRDERIGNWVVVIAYGVSGLMVIGGLVALAKLL